MDRPPFVDAHAHLWDLAALRYAWLTPSFDGAGPNGDVTSIARDHSLDDHRAEVAAAGWTLAGMVHVEAGADPSQALAETDRLQALGEAQGMPDGIVAFAALDDPDIDAALAAQAARSRVRGIRHIVNWHPDRRRTYTPRDVTGDEAWQAGFATLGRHGLSFDLQCYPAQMPGLATLFARHPETPVVVDHAGMGVDGAADWRAGMATLAALPQVSVKLSGMGFALRPLDAGAVRDRVRATIDLFGIDRCMMASDFPTDRLFASLADTLDMLADAVADVMPAERHALFAGNANRIYRLGLDLETAR